MLSVPSAIVGGLVLGAAACGGASPGVASRGSTATTAPAQGALGGDLSIYLICMHSHGVSNFPAATLFESEAPRFVKGLIVQATRRDVSSPNFQGAQRACARYYPVQTSSPRHVSAVEIQKLLAVSRCMRSHGVPNYPDPNPVTGEMVTPPGLDRHSPQVLAALRACSSLGRAAGLGPPNTGQ